MAPVRPPEAAATALPAEARVRAHPPTATAQTAQTAQRPGANPNPAEAPEPESEPESEPAEKSAAWAHRWAPAPRTPLSVLSPRPRRTRARQPNRPPSWR